MVNAKPEFLNNLLHFESTIVVNEQHLARAFISPFYCQQGTISRWQRLSHRDDGRNIGFRWEICNSSFGN